MNLQSWSKDQQKRAVVVYDLNETVSVKQLSEFFGYCGGVEKIVLNQNQGGQLFAVIVLEDQTAFTTAVLLNHAILNDTSISVVPYSDVVPSSSLSLFRTFSTSQPPSSDMTHQQRESYMEHLQQKRTAYEKMISLVSMGVIKSQQAIGELKQKVVDIDEQTHDYREQFSESTKPVVDTTRTTIESASQKLQPVLSTTKEKIDPLLEAAYEQYEKMKQSEIWENEKVKQVTFVGKVAKDELANATKQAWNAVKSSWLSFRNDVEAESISLRGAPSPSSTTEPPPVPAHLLEQFKEKEEVALEKPDDYFRVDQPQDLTITNQVDEHDDDDNEYGLPPNYTPPPVTTPTTTTTTDSDADAAENGDLIQF